MVLGRLEPPYAGQVRCTINRRSTREQFLFKYGIYVVGTNSDPYGLNHQMTRWTDKLVMD